MTALRHPVPRRRVTRSRRSNRNWRDIVSISTVPVSPDLVRCTTLEQMLELPPLTARDAAANTLWPQLSEPAPRTDCPTILPEPVLPPVKEKYAPGSPPPLAPSGNHIGFLHVLLKAELELAERAEADIVADFRQIATHDDAAAYVARMYAVIEAKTQRPC